MDKDVLVLFPNTTSKKRYHGEKFLGWSVTPDKGYVLHEVTHDSPVCDEEGNDTGEVKKRYTSATIFVGHNYDFEKNEREIYAKEIAE